jgi:hypothetical protein
MKKNELVSQALIKDGFDITNIDSKIIAKKNEIKLVINKYQEVEYRHDYIYILSQLKSKTQNVGGIDFSEIKKLLKYERKNTKSLFDTFIKVCDKYNWDNSFFSDYDLDRHSEIKYIEIIENVDDYFTFVFVKDEFNESFLAFKSRAKELLKEIQNINVRHSDLQTIAPNLKKLI